MTVKHCGNATCSNPLPIPATTRGRRMLYCSVGCRRSVEHAVRRSTRAFERIKADFSAEGEQSVRERLADNPDFREAFLVLSETYLKAPDGRTAVYLDPEVLDLLFTQDRRFNVIGHDNPLPSSADIDYAEQSGDWSAMVNDALHSMTWQLANGYKPDLRGFEDGGV